MTRLQIDLHFHEERSAQHENDIKTAAERESALAETLSQKDVEIDEAKKNLAEVVQLLLVKTDEVSQD